MEPATARFRWIARPDAPADIEGDVNDIFEAEYVRMNSVKRFILEECQGMNTQETAVAVWRGVKVDYWDAMRPGKYLNQRIELIEE